MSCCKWLTDNFVVDWLEDIADWFETEHVQSASVAVNSMMSLHTKQLAPLVVMKKLSKIRNTSLATEIGRDYVRGKIHRYKSSTLYCGNTHMDGLPIFFVKGVNQTYYDRLRDELLAQSGTGETDRDLVQFVVYSDTETPSNEAMAYHYIEHNGYNRDSTNHESTINLVIDSTHIDFVAKMYQAPDPDLTISANTVSISPTSPLLITDTHVFKKYHPSDITTTEDYILVELLDENTNITYYHELRHAVEAADTLNKIIVLHGVTGYNCCYYYEYQLGSNSIPEFEDKDNEDNIPKYNIFTMLPVITLKSDDEYVYEMKNTVNHQRYEKTRKLCDKFGMSLKALHEVITDKGTTPAEEVEATESQNNTKDVFLELGLNIDMPNKETKRALFHTFLYYHTYTTKSKDDNLQAYQYLMKHKESLGTRYNKIMKIRDISVNEQYGGHYWVKTSPAASHMLKKGEYHVEKYLLMYTDKEKQLVDTPAYPNEVNVIRPYDLTNPPTQTKEDLLEHHADILRCVYQETDDKFIYIDIVNLAVTRTVEDSGESKGVIVTPLDTWENILDNTVKTVTIPLLKEVLTHLPFSYQYNLYDQVITLVYHASVITDIHWYEKAEFIKFVQVVLVVVAVVVLYFTLGSGAKLSTVLLEIAVAISATYALNWALKQTSNKYLRGLLIVAYIAVITVYGTESGMSTSDIAMLLGTNALNAGSVLLNVKTEEEQERYAKFMDDLQYTIAELQAEIRKYEEDNPDRQFNLELFLLEDIDEFYNRVVDTDLVSMIDNMEASVLEFNVDALTSTDLLPL